MYIVRRVTALRDTKKIIVVFCAIAIADYDRNVLIDTSGWVTD